MTKTPWMNAGSLVINSSGQPILCDNCPCVTVDPCETLRNGIYERQRVINAISSYIDTSKDDYTIQQYRDFINQLAPFFMVGSYSGGASTPTMYPSNYADTGGDCAELLTLVKALKNSAAFWPANWERRFSFNTFTTVASGYKIGEGQDENDINESMKDADAEYPDGSWYGPGYPAWVGNGADGYNSSSWPSVRKWTHNGRMELSGVSDYRPKAVTFFGKMELYPWGPADVEEYTGSSPRDSWVYLEYAYIGWATSYEGAIYPSSTPTPSWPSFADPPDNLEYHKGWSMFDTMVIYAWGFAVA